MSKELNSEVSVGSRVRSTVNDIDGIITAIRLRGPYNFHVKGDNGVIDWYNGNYLIAIRKEEEKKSENFVIFVQM